MKTSYFSNLKSLKTSDVVVIAVGFPRWMKKAQRNELQKAVELMPTWPMVKKGYTYEEYTDLLKSRGVTPEAVIQAYSEKTLLCHEKNAEGCHRRMVARWLKETLHIDVPEVKPPPKKMTQLLLI